MWGVQNHYTLYKSDRLLVEVQHSGFRDLAPGNDPCVGTTCTCALCLVQRWVFCSHTPTVWLQRKLEPRLCSPHALHQGVRKASEARVQPTLSLEDGTVVYEAAALMSVNYEDLLTA